jgi:peptidoglycan/LPS O-acetylase OafA/YrhL
MNTIAKGNKIIPSLNGLRAISILIVIFSHLIIYSHIVEEQSFWGSMINGAFGVNIFFIISGFLITNLLLKEEEQNGKISMKRFYIRRILRIFPVYYSYLIVCGIMQLSGVIHLNNLAWLTSLTYTRLFYTHGMETAHFWSLSMEEGFYLIWPFVFSISIAFRKKFALTFIILIPLLRILRESHGFSFGNLSGDSIMWGCVFAIYQKEIMSTLNKFAKKSALYLLLPFAWLFLLIFIKDYLNNSSPLIYSGFISPTSTISDICIGLIIFISIQFSNNYWFKLLNLRVMNKLGILSYSIYVWQQLFFSSHIGFLSQFPINIIFILVAATISYYFIESPFIALKSRFTKSSPTESQSLSIA